MNKLMIHYTCVVLLICLDITYMIMKDPYGQNAWVFALFQGYLM